MSPTLVDIDDPAPIIKPPFVLRDYQKAAKQVLLENPYHALHLPMAFGKTLVTLAALEEMPLQGHVLVVAPVNIARLTWINEIKTFQFKLNHRSLILNDKEKPLTKVKRYERYEDTLTDPPTMYFISINLVEDLIEWMLENSSYWPFTTVIIDEAQTIKNPTSVRFKALKKIRPDLHRVIELTGTPIPDGYLDLWSQVYLLDQGLSLGPNITWYKNTFFDATKFKDNVPIKFEPKPGAVDEIKRRTKHLIAGADNTDLKLPEIISDTVKIYLSDDLMSAYKSFREEFIYDVACSIVDGDFTDPSDPNAFVPSEADMREALIASAGVLRQKLLQFASGQMYVDEERTVEVIHDEKIEACALKIQQADSPVLIAYRYQHERDRMLDELPKKYDIPVVQFDGTPTMLQAWNDRKIPVLLIHPASAGHGLNLQFGGHNLIWYTLPDSAEQFDQTNHRLRRPGSLSPSINMIILHTMGTEDDKQMPRLNDKLAVQRDFLDEYKIDVDEMIGRARRAERQRHRTSAQLHHELVSLDASDIEDDIDLVD